jgi:serine/threonine-protein kinase
LRIEHDLHSALRIDPDLVEAHEALAARHLADHANAERRREDDLALRAEMALEENIERLPADNAVRMRATRYLRGTGEVTIVTDPPGATVQLHRFDSSDRRLVPVFDRSLGTTPVLHASLPRGSYLAELRHPDRAPVRYPFEIVRDGNWDGIAPGETEPRPIPLPVQLEATPRTTRTPRHSASGATRSCCVGSRSRTASTSRSSMRSSTRDERTTRSAGFRASAPVPRASRAP